MEDRILGVGTWLDINGKAIYDTRPWKPYEENAIRFTQSKSGNKVYSIFLEWPEEELVLVKSLKDLDIIDVGLLGLDERINWCKVNEGLMVTFPEGEKRPCDNAWAFAIEIRNPKLIEPEKKVNLPVLHLNKIELSKEKIESGEAFILSVNIRNADKFSGPVKISLFIDKELFAYTRVNLKGDINQVIEFPVRIYTAGKHELGLEIGELRSAPVSLMVIAPELPY